MPSPDSGEGAHRPSFRSLLLGALVGLVLSGAIAFATLWLVFERRLAAAVPPEVAPMVNAVAVDLTPWFAAIFLVGTLLAVAAAVRLAKALAEPLERLRHNAMALAAESEVDRSNLKVPHEVAVLAAAFDDMAGRIVTRRKELVRTNSELARTRDELAAREERLRRHNAALAAIARDPALTAGDLGRAFRAITEAASSFLNVERASVWRMADEGRRLACEDLYVRAMSSHLEAESLEATRYPAYFAALRQGRHIAAASAPTDPRTAELADYLAPLGIGSMLDTAIIRSGQVIGVLCVEHVGGARTWTVDEEAFAASLTDFATLAIEAAEHRRDEEALRASERRFARAFFENPAAMTIARRSDGRLRYANRAWLKLAGISSDDMARERELESLLRVDPAARAAVERQLASDGAARDVEATVTLPNGETRRCLISAELVDIDGEPGVLRSWYDISRFRVAP
ncbi:MAG: GAF domain-containing protein [Gemmatimonadetes bacterium]|nr:GAF domain-containing protein [Gemmatimonadota bacterium]